MKRLFIVAEGQTEQEFVNTLLRPWFNGLGIYSVTPVLIKTSKHGRGGHINAQHLINTIAGLLKETNDKELVVTSFIDYFRIPNNMPGYDKALKLTDSIAKISALEDGLAETIHDWRFIPYIQRHEFEALVFSSNSGFEKYCTEEQSSRTALIVDQFDNPEDINSSPTKAPSKRLIELVPNYNKVLLGNTLALEIGLETIVTRCPRFATWLNKLVDRLLGD